MARPTNESVASKQRKNFNLTTKSAMEQALDLRQEAIKHQQYAKFLKDLAALLEGRKPKL